MNEGSLAGRILDGDVRAASRLMRNVDDRIPGAREELERLFPHTGNSAIVGITGHPGSGKSTLVNALIEHCRSLDFSIGCIAVDPTSAFSGGAILGDRVRMNQHAVDEDVFIRSVATRGNLGGLSRSTPALVLIMDAMGYDLVLIETVGVGQDEIEIVRLADTNVVVMVPGLGDDIQATKAGILEIADVFAVNKSDLEGARRVKQNLRTMLRMGRDASRSEQDWTPRIVSTVATDPSGIDELYDAISEHQTWLEDAGTRTEREARRLKQLVRLVVTGRFDSEVEERLEGRAWEEKLQSMLDRRESPYAAADAIMNEIFRSEGDEPPT